jgi:hypothetical protein
MADFALKFGKDIANLRVGDLSALRPGAAEAAQIALRAPTLADRDGDLARLKIMEGAFGALKGTPGFDPKVAGSASFKLKW